MKQNWKYIVAVILLISTISYGQLSPGDLSQAHANLEGMGKCTQCHDLGKKVSSVKCLDCHKEIQSLITQKAGYHANAEVTGKDCFSCHSEHHGRKFDMVRFDEKSFDHSLTLYKLEGKHASVECKKCHRSENILDASLAKRGNTFLGLRKECLSCHADYHQNTLPKNCLECHDMKGFKPAAKFDHKKANFKLTGKHASVDCKECHKVVTKNDKKFQEFSDVPHAECVACHTDPHNKRIQGKCTQCHTENSFKEFIGKTRFNHAATAFNLKGKHKSVDCFSCHKNTLSAATIFSFQPKVVEGQCASCHNDVHDGRMGNNCVSCHSETGFKVLKSMSTFTHANADFPLEGKHVGLDCKLCHKGSYSDPINFSTCKNCHQDYHKGEFTVNGTSPDCVECHSLKEGFSYSLYSLDQHQKAKFPLEGAHAATPCFSCHLKEEKWSFRNIGSTCNQCHKNVHGDQFAISTVTDCKRCHDPENWYPRKFEHNLTAFPLDGKHASIECRLCHKPIEKTGNIVMNYKIPKHQCIDCHQ